MKKILMLIALLFIFGCKTTEKRVTTEERIITTDVKCKVDYLTRMTSVIEYKHNGNTYLVFRGTDCIFVLKEETK